LIGKRYDAAVPTRRVLSGVLQGFIGTYTSRYSHFDGYWLFGFLVSDFAHLEVDLLNEPSAALSTAEGRARFLAILKFREQLGRAGLPVTNVARATLTIDRGEPSVQLAGERARAGFSMRFRCRATVDKGRIFEHAKDVFVAPHDPRCESQSAGTRP
jgi:hypothetical protein